MLSALPTGRGSRSDRGGGSLGEAILPVVEVVESPTRPSAASPTGEAGLAMLAAQHSTRFTESPTASPPSEVSL